MLTWRDVITFIILKVAGVNLVIQTNPSFFISISFPQIFLSLPLHVQPPPISSGADRLPPHPTRRFSSLPPCPPLFHKHLRRLPPSSIGQTPGTTDDPQSNAGIIALFPVCVSLFMRFLICYAESSRVHLIRSPSSLMLFCFYFGQFFLALFWLDFQLFALPSDRFVLGVGYLIEHRI